MAVNVVISSEVPTQCHARDQTWTLSGLPKTDLLPQSVSNYTDGYRVDSQIFSQPGEANIMVGGCVVKMSEFEEKEMTEEGLTEIIMVMKEDVS